MNTCRSVAPVEPALSGSRKDRRSPCFVVIALLAAFGGSVALAHDPYEITTDARLRPDALELVVTMARSTALAIVTGDKTSVPFDPAKFTAWRARFDASAKNLFAIDSAGSALALRESAIALTVENDVEFRLVYPRPAKSALKIGAAHLAKLGRDYGDMLTVQGDRGAFLGQQLLTAESPSLEVALAAPAASPVTASHAARPFSWRAAAIAIAAVGGGWWWRRRSLG